MSEYKYQHKEYAAGKWAQMSVAWQMANIGSEVSRTVKWRGKKQNRFESSFVRALELFDLSIEAMKEQGEYGKLGEICRAREEFCDYAVGDNCYNTDPERLVRYYDQFATLIRK